MAAPATFPEPSLPDAIRVALVVADNSRAITVPPSCRRMTFYFPDDDGKIAFVGTDATAIGVDYQVIPQGQLVEVNVAPKTTTVYIASATAPQNVQVSAELRA